MRSAEPTSVVAAEVEVGQQWAEPINHPTRCKPGGHGHRREHCKGNPRIDRATLPILKQEQAAAKSAATPMQKTHTKSMAKAKSGNQTGDKPTHNIMRHSVEARRQYATEYTQHIYRGILNSGMCSFYSNES